MYIFSYILLIILTLPYTTWGIYLLRRRIVFNEEFSPVLEGATLGGVGLYFMIMISLFRFWAQQDMVLLIFSVMGLTISAFALYGHLGISLTSRLLVDFVFDTHDTSPDKPRFSAAEALIKNGDYHAALQEYLVIARIFSNNPEVYIRIAEVMLLMERKQEAVRWFKRALRYTKTPEKSMPVINRLVYIVSKEIGDREAGAEVLEQFLHVYPEFRDREQIEKHREALLFANGNINDALENLDKLSDKPLSDENLIDPVEITSAMHRSIEISPLSESSASLEKNAMSDKDVTGNRQEYTSRTLQAGIAAIDSSLNPECDTDTPRLHTGSSLQIESLEVNPLCDENQTENEKKDNI